MQWCLPLQTQCYFQCGHLSHETQTLSSKQASTEQTLCFSCLMQNQWQWERLCQCVLGKQCGISKISIRSKMQLYVTDCRNFPVFSLRSDLLPLWIWEVFSAPKSFHDKQNLSNLFWCFWFRKIFIFRAIYGDSVFEAGEFFFQHKAEVTMVT